MSRLRIDLVAPPFRGHLHPILGLGRALRDVADVRVLTTHARLADVEASGLVGVGFLAGREESVEAIVSPNRPIRNRPWSLLRQFRAAVAVLGDVAKEIDPLWRNGRPDLTIVDSVLPSIGYLAQRLNVRWWTAIASPCAIEPLRGAPGYLGGWRHREGWIGRCRDRAGLAVVRLFKRVAFVTHRGRLRAWGAAGVYRADGTESAYSPDRILGLGMEEVEFPRRWPPAFRFLGPMLYTPPVTLGNTPTLEPERRHVLVTLGTHLPWAKAEAAAALRAIAERERQWIVHFSDGNAAGGRVTDGQFGEFFRRYAYVPYEPWLAKFDVVLHHGGAGVMYECIKAARPALVWPVDYDQFDHAARIERAGIGLRVRRWRDVPAMIERVLHDQKLRSHGMALQAKFHAYQAEERIRALVASVGRQSD